MRLPPDATLYFMYLFPFFFLIFTLHVHHQGYVKLFSYIKPFGSCSIYVVHLRVPVVWSVVVVSLYSGLVCRGGFTVQ
jgi:hypothetical protein